MTTFIYRNGELTADKRKMGKISTLKTEHVVNESKVRDFGWCKFAMSGEEKEEQEIQNTLTAVTLMEGLRFMINQSDFFAARGDSFKEGHTKLLEENCKKVRHVFSKLKMVLHSQINSKNDKWSFATGLVMTRSLVHQFTSRHYGIIIPGEPVVHGAGIDLADILVTAGVPTKEIYQHLFDCQVPTGFEYETYVQKDLPELDPPVHSPLFYETLIEYVTRPNSTKTPNLADFFPKEDFIMTMAMILLIQKGSVMEQCVDVDMRSMIMILLQLPEKIVNYDRVLEEKILPVANEIYK